MIAQKALLWWEFLPFEVVCAHPLPGHRHSSLVPTGIRGPGAQGKLEAKHDAKHGACALLREGRQHCFLTSTGCVGCVCRVRMGTGPLAALGCLCLSCHTLSCCLHPCTLQVLFKRFAACQQQGSIPPFRGEGGGGHGGRDAGRSGVSSWVGAAPLLLCSLEFQGTQVSQEGALCPPLPTGMPWLRVTSTA